MNNKVVLDFIKANVLNARPNLFNYKNSSNFQGYINAAASLNVTISNYKERSFSFWHEGKEIGGINNLRPSLVSAKAVSVCRSKSKTLMYLDSKNVQKKDYQLLDVSLKEKEVINFWNRFSCSEPLVIKPAMAKGGDGVTVNINNKETFVNAWYKAKAVIAKHGKVVVEPFFNGLDVRVIVVGGKGVCSIVRLPAYIVGNGLNKISDLIDEKNNIRSQHPHHKKFLISKDNFNYKDRVLGVNEILLLSRVGNIHQGGEAVDNTHSIAPHVVNLAEKAARAIPGLGCAGVDLMINESGDARVLEINTSSNFGIHYYPMYGDSRNPAQAVLHEMMKKSFFSIATSLSY